jgi:hypothetical protein
VERYGSVSVAALQALPNSNAKAFLMGFALGISLDGAGTSGLVRNGKQVTGSLIREDRLPHVLDALGGLDPSQWRRWVRDWEARYVAHRCGLETVCLFRKPYLGSCPACGSELLVDHVPDSPSKPRGRGRNHPSADAGRFVPPRRTIRPVARDKMSRGAEQEVPSLNTEVPHRDSGINGMAVGEGPCPDCGARSSAVGYPGHAMTCLRYSRAAADA